MVSERLQSVDSNNECCKVGRSFLVGRRGNVKSNAEYRRIGKYVKSLRRCRLERERRRRVMYLHMAGLTMGEIAVELGVGLRTVKRDFARVKPYFKSQLKHQVEELDAGAREEFLKQFEGLSMSDRLALIDRVMRAFGSGRCNRRRAARGNEVGLVLTVDADVALAGGAALSLNKENSILKVASLRLDVQLKIHGRILKLGGLTIRLK